MGRREKWNPGGEEFLPLYSYWAEVQGEKEHQPLTSIPLACGGGEGGKGCGKALRDLYKGKGVTALGGGKPISGFEEKKKKT